jgi:hypothetical protein
MMTPILPIVHKSGGPWIDILDEQQGSYGFSYSTPVEAAKYIDMLVTDEEMRRRDTLIRLREYFYETRDLRGKVHPSRNYSKI